MIGHPLLELQQQRPVGVVRCRLPELNPHELGKRPLPRGLIGNVDFNRIAIAIAIDGGEIGGQRDAARDHPVDAHVVLVRVRVDLRVASDGDGRRRAAQERLARAPAERIGIGRILNRDRLRLRPHQLVEVRQRPHVVVEQPVGGVKVGDAVVGRIPRDARPRAEVVVVAPVGPRLRKHRHVERERAVASKLVLDRAEQVGQVLVERSDLHVITDAQIERQAVAGLPIVLQVARIDLDRNVGVGRQRVGVARRPRRPIVRVVGHVAWKVPVAER